MQHLILALLLFSTSVFPVPVDHSARSFEMHQKRRQRVDRFDFSGPFPNLENIDIDARRKKCVEFDLSGDYPLLTTLNYEGSFGRLTGNLTGDFPQLSFVNLLCTSCAMELDLTGNWQKNCEINIRGQKEDLVLKLPENVGLIIHTKTGVSGKVIPSENLKKKGFFHILNKTYYNELAETAPVVLTLHIETTDGKIILL